MPLCVMIIVFFDTCNLHNCLNHYQRLALQEGVLYQAGPILYHQTFSGTFLYTYNTRFVPKYNKQNGDI